MDSTPLIPPDKNSSDSPVQEPTTPAISLASSFPSRWKWGLSLIILLLLLMILFFLKEKGYGTSFSFFPKQITIQTESARLWVHYGTLQHHIGELPEAIAAYQQAASLDPNLYEAWWNLSQIYDSLHQPQEQLNALQQAVRSRPESPEAWAALAKIYLQLHQEQEAAMSQEQEAIAKKTLLNEEDYEQLTYENPTFFEPWIQWGMSRAIYRFVQPNSYDPKTVEIFQKASEENQQNPWIWAHLGLSMIKKRNEIPGSPFLVEVEVPSLLAFQKSAELLPRNPTLFFLLGRAALWKGELNIAINAFQIATQSPQAHWLAWYYLGETYLAAHRSDEAISAYTKAQSISPDSLEIQYGVAQAYLQKGRISEARALLEKENNDPHKPIPLTRRALLQIPLHRALLAQNTGSQKLKISSPLLQSFRAASIPRLEVFTPETVSEESKQENPKNSELVPKHRSPQLPLLQENPHSENQPKNEPLPPPLPETTIPLLSRNLTSLSNPSRIGIATASLNDPLQWKNRLQDQTLDEKTLKKIITSTEKSDHPEIALEAAQQLVQRHPVAVNWIILGYLYGTQNQTLQEIDCYQKALKNDPQNRTALFNLGLTHLQIRRHSKAQTIFEKIVQNNAEDYEAWFHLGLSFERQERWNEASSAYQQAIALNRAYGNAWLNLGGVYASIKRADLEIETYKKCLESNPDYQPAWNNLAIVLKNIGKFSDYEVFKKRLEATSR